MRKCQSQRLRSRQAAVRGVLLSQRWRPALARASAAAWTEGGSEVSGAHWATSCASVLRRL